MSTWRFPQVLRVLLSVIFFTNLLLLLLARTSFAQEDGGADPLIVASDAIVSINVLYVVLAAFLIFFMQAGFALVEAGFTRSKNVAHTMMMVLMCLPIAALGYWLMGFALQFGGINHTYVNAVTQETWRYAPVSLGNWENLLAKEFLIANQGIMGWSGFMLSKLDGNFGIMAFFFFQLCFMAACAAIPTGAMAERLHFIGYVLTTVVISLLIYPLVGNWMWGGGWLANLGRSIGLGNGAVDYAGSGVIHMTGGAVALAGTIVLGPRIGKFNKDGSANSIAGHNLPLGILGTFILFLGWFAFNSGSALGFTGGFRNLAVNAIVTTLLSGSAGGVTAMFYMWLWNGTRKPDPVMSVNGLLAGTVAITAPCAFIDTWAAIVIGCVAGILVCLATIWLDQVNIDDPVGAIPVHLVNGAWGLLAAGLFASSKPDTYLWNGVPSSVKGLFFGGSTQLTAQTLAIVAIFIVAFSISYVLFTFLNRAGLLRVSSQEELGGLDAHQMGVAGYATESA